MSVLKRLTNVARGKMLEIGRELSGDGPEDPGGDDPGEVDPDRPPKSARRPSDGEGAGASNGSREDKRALLVRMRDEGLLTAEEFDAKIGALDAPPPAPTARKRRL